MVVDEFDEVRVDGVAEGFFDDLDRFGSGDAESAHEFRLEACLLHGCRDGLAAAVDQDGIDAGDFEKDDVAHEGADEGRDVHGGATDLDEKGLPAKPLQVRQGLDQGGGFVIGGHDSQLAVGAGRSAAGRYRAMRMERSQPTAAVARIGATGVHW